MNLKTLGRTTWKEIEIGEVFAFNGCWSIFEKVSKTKAKFIDCDDDSFSGNRYGESGDIFEYRPFGGFGERWKRPYGCVCNIRTYTNDCLYKLSQSVQRLWKTE